jgi:hypothetical protein
VGLGLVDIELRHKYKLVQFWDSGQFDLLCAQPRQRGAGLKQHLDDQAVLAFPVRRLNQTLDFGLVQPLYRSFPGSRRFVLHLVIPEMLLLGGELRLRVDRIVVDEESRYKPCLDQHVRSCRCRLFPLRPVPVGGVRSWHSFTTCAAGAHLYRCHSAHAENQPVGFGAGCVIALFWNYINLFVTTFFKAGLQQLTILLQTGQLHRPDLLIAVIAVAGHFLLIIACLGGFLRTLPGGRAWGQFMAGGALAIGYFVAIIITTGPQYVGLLKRVFRL